MSTVTQKIKIVKIILNKSIFDENIIDIILQYYWNILDCKKKILINWIKINIKKINWGYLSKNTNAIDLLKENQNKISWNILSMNPNAIDLLKENQDKISWYGLSLNPNAIQILKENQNKINWFELSENPSIFEFEHMPI